MSQEPASASSSGSGTTAETTAPGINSALASVVKVYVDSLIKDKSRLSVLLPSALPSFIIFPPTVESVTMKKTHILKKIIKLWDVCMAAKVIRL